MSTLTLTETVTGAMNFAADRTDGGIFSNYDPGLVRQDLQGASVVIRNGRIGTRRPTLHAEGMQLARHSSGAADWWNPAWLQSEYVPSCIALVQQLTGANAAFSLHQPLLRRVDSDKHGPEVAPPAWFVHIDNTRDQVQLTMAKARADGLSFSRARVYNVWKCITPPPQDRPLAIASIGSVADADCAPSTNMEWIEGEKRAFATYLTPLPSESARWFYFPDMTPDESIVFIGADPDPSRPVGCAHGSFRDPQVSADCPPRASFETRIVAMWE